MFTLGVQELLVVVFILAGMTLGPLIAVVTIVFIMKQKNRE